MSIFPVNARNRLVSRYFIRDLEVPIFSAKIIRDLAFGKTRAIVADEIKDLTHDVCDTFAVPVLHTFFRYNKNASPRNAPPRRLVCLKRNTARGRKSVRPLMVALSLLMMPSPRSITSLPADRHLAGAPFRALAKLLEV